MKEGIEIANPEAENPQAVIGQIRQEVAMMGRNDSEFSRLDDIEGKLVRGEYTPEEAIDLARQVRYGKQEH